MMSDQLCVWSDMISDQYKYLCITGSGPEMQILNYVTHQYKLLPEIANSYALKMASRFMMEMYVSSKGQIQEGDLSSLPVVSI